MSILIAEDLAKEYNSRQVVKSLSINVKSGEIVGLLGPNGAGKTTAFYMIVGLATCKRGQISIDDNNLTSLPMHQRAQLERLLDQMNINDLRNTLGISLSGGERRRVEIARTLATRPKFILLDEPFAGVDPISVLDIQRIIKDLARQDIGVLITDHNVRETLGICTKGYVINEGLVIASGTPEQILNNKEVKKVYLGEEFKM